MKIARYRIDGETAYGILRDDGAIDRLVGDPFGAREKIGQTDDLSAVRLLAPVDAPRVIGAGLNYVSHIEEMGLKTPTIPMLFMKPSTTVIGPDDDIVYPRQGETVHFEGELAVVIGREVRNVPEASALDAVLGYTCANDVSERVIQKAEMAMGCLLVSKGFDTFCPLGPVIATDLDPANLELSSRVNGERRQGINTSDLLFSVAKLVSYLSHAMTLVPGDVIISGTPSGVGPIQPGDTIEVEVEGIGVLRNSVVADRDA